MSNVDELREKELEELDKVELVEEEFNLEELILLGDDKKIPILLQYPLPDGRIVKGKAKIKQLTLSELETVKTSPNNQLETITLILRKAFFQMNEEPFTKTQLRKIPIGVLKEVCNKILEVSGFDEDLKTDLINF